MKSLKLVTVAPVCSPRTQGEEIDVGGSLSLVSKLHTSLNSIAGSFFTDQTKLPDNINDGPWLVSILKHQGLSQPSARVHVSLSGPS